MVESVEMPVSTIGEVAVEADIVWGTADKVFPVRQARDAVSCLHKGQLEIVQGCGHLPQVEQPEQFATILNRFLANPHHAG